MTGSRMRNKERAALWFMLVINIFLCAFLLGQVGLPAMIFPDASMEAHPAMPEAYPPAPPWMRGSRADMPPPPPFFGLGDLFSPAEMKEQAARLRKQFDQVSALRLDFARRLQNGPVSKEEVLRHFADTEEVLESVKRQAQERAADRISSMPPEDRKRFAQRLASPQPRFPLPPDAPPGP